MRVQRLNSPPRVRYAQIKRSQKCHGQLPSLRLRTTEHCDQRQGFMAPRSLTAQACLCIWAQPDAAGHSRLSGHLFLHEDAHTTNSYMPMSLAETTQISALCAEERASQGDTVTCKIDTPLLPYVSKVVEASLKTKPRRVARTISSPHRRIDRHSTSRSKLQVAISRLSIFHPQSRPRYPWINATIA